MLSLSVNLKLPAHGTPSSPEKHASARGACFSAALLGGGLAAEPPPDATRPGMLPGLIERNTDSTAWLKAY